VEAGRAHFTSTERAEGNVNNETFGASVLLGRVHRILHGMVDTLNEGKLDESFDRDFIAYAQAVSLCCIGEALVEIHEELVKIAEKL
jgi:hypothetical protein